MTIINHLNDFSVVRHSHSIRICKVCISFYIFCQKICKYKFLFFTLRFLFFWSDSKDIHYFCHLCLFGNMEDSFLQNPELLFHHQTREYIQGFIHTPQICIGLVASQTVDFLILSTFFLLWTYPFAFLKIKLWAPNILVIILCGLIFCSIYVMW